MVLREQPVWLYADDAFPEASDYDDEFAPRATLAALAHRPDRPDRAAQARLAERLAATACRAIAALRRVFRSA